MHRFGGRWERDGWSTRELDDNWTLNSREGRERDRRRKRKKRRGREREKLGEPRLPPVVPPFSWNAIPCSGMTWSEVEWNVAEWNGMEWNVKGMAFHQYKRGETGEKTPIKKLIYTVSVTGSLHLFYWICSTACGKMEEYRVQQYCYDGVTQLLIFFV